MEVDDDHSSSKKRRHPDSSVTAPASSTSLDILRLVEHANFEELSRWNPFFAKAWETVKKRQKETQKTFSACVSQAFTVALTRALLKTYLRVQLPYLEDNHLCPPVPNRFFYLHWIHSELLRGNSQLGLDIGAGATAIYSLMAAKFFHCQMITTEIDPAAAELARRNVQANDLTPRVHVALVAPSHSQDPGQAPGGPLDRGLEVLDQFAIQRQGEATATTLDFVMTNPPFNDPHSREQEQPRAGDGRARTNMTVSEGNYPGGEVGFVTEMLACSLRRPRSSKWFSSMLGKKSSLMQLQKMISHVIGPAHIRVTEYGPGNYTRWFLAWTMEQPEATAPEAKAMDLHFRVNLTKSNPISPLDEVVGRIVTYCQSSPGGWSLNMRTLNPLTNHSQTGGRYLQIQEATVDPIRLFVDETSSDTAPAKLHIPDMVLESLAASPDNSCFLPKEGHFVLSVSILPLPDSSTGMGCQVHVVGYRHSARGEAALKKIGSSLEGEVCRSNRFWRRKLQRKHANAMND